MASEAARRAFGDAIRRRLDDLGNSQEWLAELLGVTQGQVSLWIRGLNNVDPERAITIEKHLQMRPGSLTRHLGYVSTETRPARSVRDAVAQDDRLTDVAKAALLASYNVFVKSSEARGDAS